MKQHPINLTKQPTFHVQAYEAKLQKLEKNAYYINFPIYKHLLSFLLEINYQHIIFKYQIKPISLLYAQRVQKGCWRNSTKTKKLYMHNEQHLAHCTQHGTQIGIYQEQPKFNC